MNIKKLLTKLIVVAMLLAPTQLQATGSWWNAVKSDNSEMIQLLLNEGAQVNTRNKQGQTALFYATTRGHLKSAQLLIDNRAEINIQDQDVSRTPLMYASRWGKAEAVQLLLDNGAKITIKDNNGFTAYDYARKNKNAETRQATCTVLEQHINKISDTRKNHIVRILRPMNDQLPIEMTDYIAQYVYPQITLDNTEVTTN